MVTLDDIRLRKYTLDTLPRLANLRRLAFSRKPEICIERARYVTKYLKHYDNPKDTPELRQAKKVRHFLQRKRAIFHDENLLAGTTTSKPLGAPLFPEFFALTLWPELQTVSTREKNPQILSESDAMELDRAIFPFWMDKNVLEVARKRFNNPGCIKLFESLVFFIAGKAGCISHCVPGYEAMLEKGLTGFMREAADYEQRAWQSGDEASEAQADFYKAVQISLAGIIEYAKSLAEEAEYLAQATDDLKMQQEFIDIATVCRRVPASPARTFREAVNAIWICQVGIHAENINMAMSPGRLDQVLYPYYKRDIENGTLNVAGAIEIIGCLWLKLSDNVAMVPEASEEMFGGAGTVPAITLGGVDSTGEDAVNDLSYIMLRVTELLKTPDPNVNARYHYQKNSPEWRQCVSETIINTSAIPAFFNDVKNIEALQGQGVTVEHARDYAVIGCVELASSGRDYPSSSSIMLNLTAPLEMALYGGRRPITGNTQIGPETLFFSEMHSYAEFKEAFFTQLDWLIEQAVQTNEYLGQVHQDIMPSPLLSSFFEGPLKKGRDLIHGGAVYNSSGVTHIGFADVVDSLSAIETVVFADRRVTSKKLVAALTSDFSGNEGELIRLKLKNKAPKFGTEEPIAQNNASDIVEHLYKKYQSFTNYRGGKYRPAYWTMTNHAGLGVVTGATPNGRRKNEVFASGITPVSGAATDLTSCLNSVAALGGEQVPGCWALNIKYSPERDRAAMAIHFGQTIEAYFRAGGQQVQFNIMDYEMLEAAKEDPTLHPELIVRVSGYSAKFNALNPAMKDELITRTQYNLGSGHAVPFPGQ